MCRQNEITINTKRKRRLEKKSKKLNVAVKGWREWNKIEFERKDLVVQWIFLISERPVFPNLKLTGSTQHHPASGLLASCNVICGGLQSRLAFIHMFAGWTRISNQSQRWGQKQHKQRKEATFDRRLQLWWWCTVKKEQKTWRSQRRPDSADEDAGAEGRHESHDQVSFWSCNWSRWLPNLQDVIVRNWGNDPFLILIPREVRDLFWMSTMNKQ